MNLFVYYTINDNNSEKDTLGVIIEKRKKDEIPNKIKYFY